MIFFYTHWLLYMQCIPFLKAECRTLCLWSKWAFMAFCRAETRCFNCAGSWADGEGFRTARLVCIFLPWTNSKGETPVTAWGVARYICKKSVTVAFHGAEHRIADWIVLLSTLWNRSIAPFEAGWYTDVRMCLMSLTFRNAANSGEVNWEQLSLTILVGLPCYYIGRIAMPTEDRVKECGHLLRSKSYLGPFTITVSECQSVSTVPGCSLKRSHNVNRQFFPRRRG